MAFKINFTLLFLLTIFCLNAQRKNKSKPRAYYFSISGKDSNNGSKITPFKTFSKINNLQLKDGDSILFKSNEVFYGTLLIENTNAIIFIASYGKGSATINGENNQAIILKNCSNFVLENLNLVGSGRKQGNIANGFELTNSFNCRINGLKIRGFQKVGLYVFSSNSININNCIAENNGSAGIMVDGTDKKSSKNIIIKNSKAFNNPGDPTNFTNHSGNGILVGLCTKVLIDHCEAYNNGWDMPRNGNGPVGIWTYESDSVVIQNSISHHNKTSDGGIDGGGFDLDGGVTNAIIQNCKSYENEGAGYGIYQYEGASNWNNNKIINCSSFNDGLKTSGKASIYIWNSAEDDKQFKNLLFKNNTIINTNNLALNFDLLSKHESFRFIGNKFTGKDSVLVFKELNVKDKFHSNKWTSLKRGVLKIDEILNDNLSKIALDQKNN